MQRSIKFSRLLRKRQTDAEKKLWHKLRNRSLNGVKFRRQHSIDKYVLDFYSPDQKLGIELDGSHHLTKFGKVRDLVCCLLLTSIHTKKKYSSLRIYLHKLPVNRVFLGFRKFQFLSNKCSELWI